MMALLAIAVIALIFYAIDHLVYRGQKDLSPTTFLKVLFNFLFMLVTSAVCLLLIMTVILGGLALFDWAIDGFSQEQILGRINGTEMLFFIFVIIFLGAMVHFLFREFLIKHGWIFRFRDDDYVINEYLIQWSTIYLAVYQFMFDGVKNVAKELVASDNTQEIFNIVLSPENINLAVQPLLICSWIALVMERLRFRKGLGVHADEDVVRVAEEEEEEEAGEEKEREREK
ncbi:SA1002 family membrane protein [Corynebacterium falsenii]|uniref:SA1002 family membrane protein n=1 Tax=Corynebacterium falsenii TaxID=108486 RepID=UPI001CCAC4B8|nr:hypothetical protein [Corynebacterium falsenii]UBI07305.1 hypothetical protein LA329_03100 [Corynebacterium falsenii]HJF11711.1 hypothetical protein [Corynebacterium falsenii]